MLGSNNAPSGSGNLIIPKMNFGSAAEKSGEPAAKPSMVSAAH
jgi:hypothetical protein